MARNSQHPPPPHLQELVPACLALFAMLLALPICHWSGLVFVPKSGAFCKEEGCELWEEGLAKIFIC